MSALQQWAKLAEIENIRMRANMGLSIKAAETAKVTGRMGGKAKKKIRAERGPQINADKIFPIIQANPGILKPDLRAKSGLRPGQFKSGLRMLYKQGKIIGERTVGSTARYWPVGDA